jgi:hypothetical protein
LCCVFANADRMSFGEGAAAEVLQLSSAGIRHDGPPDLAANPTIDSAKIVRIAFPPAASPVRTALLRHFEENAELGFLHAASMRAPPLVKRSCTRPTRKSAPTRSVQWMGRAKRGPRWHYQRRRSGSEPPVSLGKDDEFMTELVSG